MPSRFSHTLLAVGLLVLASCSGQGCTSGCGGMKPLSGGFPKEKTVEHAASVRISRQGLDFVQANLRDVVSKIVHLTNGNLSFELPETFAGRTILIDSPGTALDVSADIHLCDGGPKDGKCKADIGLGSATFQVDAVTPNALRVRGTIPIKLSDTPVRASVDPGSAEPVVHVGYGDGTCNGGTPNVTAHPLPITVSIPLVTETIAPRTGYTTIDIDNATIDLSELSSDQLQICAGCAGIDYCNDVLNSGFVKNKVLGALKSNIEGKIRDLLRGQLCTKPNPAQSPTCPSGSAPDDGNAKCVFDSNKDKCVPILLGTDAHVDLGQFLARFSPGTSGGLDFVLAAGGTMQPLPNAGDDDTGRTPNGATLTMVGGLVPQPPSNCVPLATLTPPTGVPVPDELAPKKAEPAGTPHVGIALSGRFVEYALGGIYNSGSLCLGVSTEQFDMLKSGLLSLVIPSIKTLTFEQTDAAAAITTRPQAAPTLKIGQGTEQDPLLSITLPKFALDFYVWHLDRYVRAFTFEGDLTVPLNLQTGKQAGKDPPGGIVPVVGDLSIANAVVTNSELLMDAPDAIASALTDLLGGLAKQLLGNGFSSFDLSSAISSYGLSVDIAEIRKLTKNTDDFVGIFANLSAKKAQSFALETQAVVASKTVHPEHLQLSTYTRGELPELTLDVSAYAAQGEPARGVEYTWWIDGGSRSAWTTDAHFVVKDTQLMLQGRHVLHVSSRIQGEGSTEDPTPAEVPFVVDAVAPFVTVKREGGAVSIDAWDLVSKKETLTARYRLDGAPVGPFVPLADVARVAVDEAETLELEVRDEEGNVRTVRQALRGREDDTLAQSASGCGCSTPGTMDAGGGLGLALGLAGLGLIALRRRSARASTASRSSFAPPARLVALGVAVVGAATTQGCSCGGTPRGADTGCGHDCNQVCEAPLPPGTPGAYTSVAKASDGSIWVAGYNDALLFEGETQFWGDLVVGKYDLGKQGVRWTTVDGLPVRAPGSCADRDKTTWRNGELEAGEDVGLWTSIQVGEGDHPMVAYYDATNHRLKFAAFDSGWRVAVLDEVANGDVGRYAKMLLVDGKPVIAYARTEPGEGGKTRSTVVVARATVPVPHGPSDFTFQDAAVVEDDPCGPTTCPADQRCLADGTCAQSAVCSPECGSGEVCVERDGAPSCVAQAPAFTTYPNVFGDYIALAVGPEGLVVSLYDRPHGNLVVLREREGVFSNTIVDGETGNRAELTAVDTGDVGIGSSLAVDPSGTIHLSYVSGIDETLRYVTLTGDTPGTPQIVDDGTALDGQPFADGKHVVGDDSILRVDGTTIEIFYQDATAGVLRRAVGTPSGPEGELTWSLRSVPQDGKFAGFFPQLVPGEPKVANFWRQTDRASKSVVADVAIVSP